MARADVLLVSLGGTAGLREADAELAGALRRAGATVAEARAKPVPTAATWGSKNASAAAPTVRISSGHRRLSSVTPGCSSGSELCMRAAASSFAIGGVVSARRPIATPIPVATTHQARAT